MEKKQYRESFEFPHFVEVIKYKKLAKIGQGTFGEVYKAQDKVNPQKYVALKKILVDGKDQGLPITALREIKLLKGIRHQNVINLIEVCRTKPTAANKFVSNIYLVLEFCEHDLLGLLKSKITFSVGHIKNVLQQIFNGLSFIHSKKILHRDLKPANILITKTGIIKLCDFGLARTVIETEKKEDIRYTSEVVTLWYRCPEILLREKNYGPPVDIWAAGCIMAQLWTRRPILMGNSEQDQLNKILQLCGSITPVVWPGVQHLELYKKLDLPRGLERKLTKKLGPFLKDSQACDLIEKLLVLDPSQRYDAESALKHSFFGINPMPTDLSEVLAQYTESMFAAGPPQALDCQPST